MLYIKMVIALFRPFIGGAERQAELLAKILIKRNVDVEVFAERPRGVPAQLPDDPFVVHRLWVPGYRRVRIFLLIGALYRALLSCRHSIDIIHVHQAGWPAFAAVLAAKRLNVPVLIKCTNSGPRFDLEMLKLSLPLGHSMARYIAHNASCFVSLNQEATSQLAQWGVEDKRVVHIPNGVLVPDRISAAKRLKHRSDLGLSNKSYVIIGIGSLTAKKDFSTLVKAIAQCNRSFPCTLLLIGDGPLRSELEAQCANLGIASNVRFIGRVPPSQVRVYLTAANLFVLPSLTEGISNALLEAMGSGLPCVASNIPGNRLLVDNRLTGLLFIRTNVDALVDAIRLVRTQPELGEVLAKRARQKILTDFDIERVADQYLQLYENLLGNKK